MPAATPLPGPPTAFTLGSADALLDGQGCGICRYVTGASGQYLSWFALEAYADPGMVNRLCGSAGMCPGHSRALISQPGAARRLTPLYLCILRAVPALLGAPRTRLARCPACEHGDAVTGRAVGIVVDEVGGELREGTCHPGLSQLCLPHAHAVGAKAYRRASRRLARAIVTSAVRWPVGIEELTGGPDYEVDVRAELRARLPSPEECPPGTCPVCLAGAHAERTRVATAANGGDVWPGSTGLCPAHLRDVAAIDPASEARAVAAEFRRQAGALFMLAEHRRWGVRKRAASSLSACFVCQTREYAAEQALERHRAGLSSGHPDSAAVQLCVRHVVSLLESVPAAGRLAVRAATAKASSLSGELGEAFDKSTWPRRPEPKGPETTAWLRAAAFLDGQVFGGGPPFRQQETRLGPQ